MRLTAKIPAPTVPYEEKLATCFAANLLMPGDTFRSAIESRSADGKIEYINLYDVAREFDVSIESVIWRMHYVYNRGPDRSDETITQIEKVKAFSSNYENRKEEAEFLICSADGIVFKVL